MTDKKPTTNSTDTTSTNLNENSNSNHIISNNNTNLKNPTLSIQSFLDQKLVKYILILTCSILLITLLIIICRRRDKMKRDEQMRLLRQNKPQIRINSVEYPSNVDLQQMNQPVPRLGNDGGVHSSGENINRSQNEEISY